jgi:4-hydroxy-3-polyprenylbenzoate decarboxylase
MSHDYYSDFRAYLDELEKRGRLHRWRRPVNKDTELMPLMRLQYRGIEDGKRRAFLYENVRDGTGKQFDIRVATGVYGSSRDVTALGLGCDDPRDIYEKWRDALAHLHEPRIVSSAPVQEEVYGGARLKEFPVTRLPSPVEEPGFSCGIRVTAPFITKDPDTGMRNVGMYSGHFRGDQKLIAGIARTHHALLYHHPSAALQGTVAGGDFGQPAGHHLCFRGESSVRHDEIAVAGGIRRRPVEMARAKPFLSKFLPTRRSSMKAKFPSTKGAERAVQRLSRLSDGRARFRAVIDVAITMRRDAIFTAILVGLPPSESNGISRSCREMMLYSFLKYSCNLPDVLEVCCPEMGGGWNWWVIRMRKGHPSKPQQALQAASGMDPANKFIIVVDEDIDPKDPDMVMWALSFSTQPHRDVRIITGRVPLLDPSAYSLISKPEERSYPPPVGCSGILIDATRKGPYPPVGLPKREYMERALEIWKEEELPPLALKSPWYGYALGLWNAEDDAMAEAIARGEPVVIDEKLKG